LRFLKKSAQKTHCTFKKSAQKPCSTLKTSSQKHMRFLKVLKQQKSAPNASSVFGRFFEKAHLKFLSTFSKSA